MIYCAPLTLSLIFILIKIMRKHILTSSMLWIISYTTIFFIYPVISEQDYFAKAYWYSVIGLCSYIFGSILGANITLRAPKRMNVDKNKNEYLSDTIGGNTFFTRPINYHLVCIARNLALIACLSLLLINFGINGVSAILVGKLTTESMLGSASAVATIFSSMLNVYACLLIMSFILLPQNTSKKFFGSCLLHFVIYAVLIILFSYTRIWLIMMIACLYMYYMQGRSRRITVVYSVLILLILLYAMVVMGYVRVFGFAALSNFFNYVLTHGNIKYFILQSLDFYAAYNWFIQLLNYPKFYISPAVYLKPLLMIFPRSIFPNKPEALSVQVLRNIAPDLVAAGYSTGFSLLGEAYAVCGTIGIFLYPFIWGIFCEVADKKQIKRYLIGQGNTLATVLYYLVSFYVIIYAQRGDLVAGFQTILTDFIIVLVIFAVVARKKPREKILTNRCL